MEETLDEGGFETDIVDVGTVNGRGEGLVHAEVNVVVEGDGISTAASGRNAPKEGRGWVPSSAGWTEDQGREGAVVMKVVWEEGAL